MSMMHLVGGPSAAEALRSALSGNLDRRTDAVMPFPDDLASGPLAPDTPAVRVQWWTEWWGEMVRSQTGDDPDLSARLPQELAAFWGAVDSTRRLVVWYGRDNASELALFHSVCDELHEQPFDVVEIPGAVGACTPDELANLLTSAHPISPAKRSMAQRTWQQLKEENATFRVVTSDGLVSARANYYDDALLNAVGSEWTPIMRVIAPVMAEMNVGDSILIWRVKSLTASGALITDGNPFAQQTKVKCGLAK